MDKDILRKWLKSGYVETGRLFPTDHGSPQGSAISPTICNMVLDGLEIQIKKKYHKTKRDGKAYFPKVNFIRYIVVLVLMMKIRLKVIIQWSDITQI